MYTTTSHENATVTSNRGVTLTDGSGSATIDITAENGVTTKTYTVNFTTQKQSPALSFVSTSSIIREEKATFTLNQAPPTGSSFALYEDDTTEAPLLEPVISVDGNKLTLTFSNTPTSYTNYYYITTTDTVGGKAERIRVCISANKQIPDSGSDSTFTISFNVNGGSSIGSVNQPPNAVIDLSKYIPKKEGYTFDGWFSDSSFETKVNKITLTKDITLYAKWSNENKDTTAEIKEDNKDQPKEEDNRPKTDLYFNDVKESDWFYNDVKYMYEKGLMKGITNELFAPYDTLTREMFVEILYRLAGSPKVSGQAQFDDVAYGMYYYDAIIWAKQNDITSGYGNIFGVGKAITREEFIVLLNRYAEYINSDVKNEFGDTPFSDMDKCSK